jgi:hypothetical protein
MGFALTCAMLSPAQAQIGMGGGMATPSNKMLKNLGRALEQRREDRIRRPREPVMTGRPVGPSRVVRPLPSTGSIRSHTLGKPDTRPRPGQNKSVMDYAHSAADRGLKPLSQSPAITHTQKRMGQALNVTVATGRTAKKVGGVAVRAGGSALKAGARAAGKVGSFARKLSPF